MKNLMRILVPCLVILCSVGLLSADSYYFRDVHYDDYHPQCRTHNKVVKQINGGAPRYVVNGTYTVCGEKLVHHVVREPVYVPSAHYYPVYHAPRHRHIPRGYYYH
jgi:hypothetical protein